VDEFTPEADSTSECELPASSTVVKTMVLRDGIPVDAVEHRAAQGEHRFGEEAWEETSTTTTTTTTTVTTVSTTTRRPRRI
jgi:hypothetical protein